MGSPALWLGFIAFVLVMLALDLGVFHRKAHAVSFREAISWTGVWVVLALVFNGVIWWRFGPEPAVQFLAAWLVEKSLSIDNVFVFLAIFSMLAIPAVHQHRVLFWGIVSALGLRAAMIFAGAAALARFEWLVYVFGAFLVFTGVKLFVHRDREPKPPGTSVGFVGRFVPMSPQLDGGRFFTVKNGKRFGTPLLSALILIELADVVFAVDSIPVVLGITADPFIVFTSNVFAMLGLRSMFFAVAGAAQRFAYLKIGLAAVLVFVGVKMALVDVVEIGPLVSLTVIVVLLSASMLASVFARRGAKAPGIAAVTHTSSRA